ncbi:MAG: hypothetical protein ACPG19_14630 [Saprospiraceae bacterium]
MKLLNALPIILICILISKSSSADEVIKIKSTLAGGISGIENSIQPNIEFESSYAIFKHLKVTKADIGKEFTISSNQDDPNFKKFSERLTDGDDEVMKVGHVIGYVKGNLGNYETTWFDKKDLYQKYVSKITIQYSSIEFGEPYFKENDYWTDFQYEVLITFHLEKKQPWLVDFISEDFQLEDAQTKGKIQKKKRITAEEFLKKDNKTPKKSKRKFKIELKYIKE